MCRVVWCLGPRKRRGDDGMVGDGEIVSYGENDGSMEGIRDR